MQAPNSSPPPDSSPPRPRPPPPELMVPSQMPSFSHYPQEPSEPSTQNIQLPSSPKQIQLPLPPGRQNSKVSSSSSSSPISHEASRPPAPDVTPPDETQATTTSVQWSTGLCECQSDIPNCLITCFCPCITFGEISEIVDEGTSSCAINGAVYALLAVAVGCACIYSAFYRRRMRHQYNLEGSNLRDCCVHSCCEICALTQEYRELRNRGHDLSSGWHANIDRQNEEAMTIPPPHTSMRR